jgi:hypothetical protein
MADRPPREAGFFQQNKDRGIPVGNLSVVEIVDCSLKFARPLSAGEATHLRGYFGRAFTGEVLLHHHNPDGSLRYDYPRVQFKVIERTAHLIGIAEGADLVTKLWLEVDRAALSGESLPILESTLNRRRDSLGEAAELVAYRLRTPWLGLNQENFRVFGLAKDSGQRCALLERILIGNCLAMAKAFGHRVRAHLTADASRLRPHTTHLKGVAMVAFVGTFRVNFMIPNRAGVGKSVSRGFGTVERVGEKEEKSSC